ncbi:MAG: hypothetical protein K2H47_05910 [Muribaculaceae bacterium]|nr:hypothetical protein [Muribaculaceae bacterium]
MIRQEEINDIYLKRLQKDEDLFYIKVLPIETSFDVKLIRRKKFYGICCGKEQTAAPVFDEIVLFSESIADVKIQERHALFDLNTKRLISKFLYERIEKSGNWLILHRPKNRIGIYDLLKSCLLVEDGSYEAYNLKDDTTEYLWVRRGKYYDYINRETGKLHTLPGVIMAYDTSHGLFGLGEYGKVTYFNEYGVPKPKELRQIVLKAGGHLVLNNFTYNIQHIIDVYGNILNI